MLKKLATISLTSVAALLIAATPAFAKDYSNPSAKNAFKGGYQTSFNRVEKSFDKSEKISQPTYSKYNDSHKNSSQPKNAQPKKDSNKEKSEKSYDQKDKDHEPNNKDEPKHSDKKEHKDEDKDKDKECKYSCGEKHDKKPEYKKPERHERKNDKCKPEKPEEPKEPEEKEPETPEEDGEVLELETLPETAIGSSNPYNWVLVASALLSTGAALYVVSKKYENHSHQA